jgi:outer membrane protein OmpA-like peptidoglycan-associated protein
MKTKIIITILIFSSVISFAQTLLADKFFDKFAYLKAAELYEKAYDKGDDSEHVLTRLGDCYYKNSNADKAVIWYEKAVDKYENRISTEYIFNYIVALRSLGKYEEANDQLQKFNDRQNSDSRFAFNANNLSLISELSSLEKVVVEVFNLGLNTEYSDFGGYVHNNTLYFASTREVGGKIYKWNEQPYLDIYKASISGDGKEFSNIDFISSEDIKSDYHEATLAITKDGKTMYFTRDNLNKRDRLDYNKGGTSNLNIYKATYEGGFWGNIKKLPFNSDDYSTGHPALSPDEKQLYFVSDMPESIGQTDIFVVDILENDQYGSPSNLGETVNSEGREMFPFVSNDSILYFSSDGRITLGLLDIYKSDIIKNPSADPVNLGAPFNGGNDDFAFYIDSETETGYFSSNRTDDAAKGNDDIYGFAILECKQYLKGVVKNSETQEPIPGATVSIIDETGKIIETLESNENGEYNTELECDKTYSILGHKDDYKDDIKSLMTNDEDAKEHEVDLNLTPLIKDDQIVINPIFFDFDKWNIRTDAKYELENIVDVMRQHPNMVIKIESHTDSRGSDSYNMKLSDRRANSTREYLLSRGISNDRIESAIGYGESQLLNECSNGVKCPEEKHQMNRRSYFYIIKN